MLRKLWIIQFLCGFLWNTTATFYISQQTADYLLPCWPTFDLKMSGSQALKNALGNPVLLSPPLFFHPDTTGMSTISGENENQIAYQELTIWGSWLLLPSPLPDVSSLPQIMWYQVLVSPQNPFQICFCTADTKISSGFVFSKNVSSFPSGFLGPLQATAICFVAPCPLLLLPRRWTLGLEIRRGGQEKNVSRWDLPDPHVARGEPVSAVQTVKHPVACLAPSRQHSSSCWHLEGLEGLEEQELLPAWAKVDPVGEFCCLCSGMHFMLRVKNEGTGRRRGVCNQMLSAVRQSSAVQRRFPLAGLSP